MTRGSLRRRLFLTFIGPLMIAACLAGLFRYSEFTRLSRTLYDTTLLSIAIAVSRAVAVN
ncbi:hypothetical protein FGG78_30905 [Thioclava sp. BHET1]|nr:hypothetical protein FGG78_30905 [Thioclava sp. BHET1]